MKILSWLLLLAVLIFGFYLILAQKTVAEYDAPPKPKGEMPLTLLNPRLTEWEDNRPVLVMRAVKAEILESRATSLLFNVDGEFLTKEDKKILFTAKRARLWSNKGKARFWGEVEFKTHKAEQLQAEWVVFDRAKGVVFSNSPIVLKGKNSRIEAKGMRLNLKKDYWVFDHPQFWFNP